MQFVLNNHQLVCDCGKIVGFYAV